MAWNWQLLQTNMCAYILHFISHLIEKKILEIEDSTNFQTLQILWIPWLSWVCEHRKRFTCFKSCVKYGLNVPWSIAKKICPKSTKLKPLRTLFQGVVLCQGPRDDCTRSFNYAMHTCIYVSCCGAELQNVFPCWLALYFMCITHQCPCSYCVESCQVVEARTCYNATCQISASRHCKLRQSLQENKKFKV